MALNLLRIATILLVALLTGLSFAHVLEMPAKLQYDAALYVYLQKTLYMQWGPPNIGGFLEPVAIVVSAVLAFFMRHRKPTLWFCLAALAALLLAFPAVFYWLVEPSNKVFLGTAPANIPPEWETLRSHWETGHAIRFALHLTALSLLLFSTTRNTLHPYAGR